MKDWNCARNKIRIGDDYEDRKSKVRECSCEIKSFIPVWIDERRLLLR